MSLVCVLSVFSKNAREKDISFYFSNLGSSKDIFNEGANKYVTAKYLYDMSYHVVCTCFTNAYLFPDRTC